MFIFILSIFKYKNEIILMYQPYVDNILQMFTPTPSNNKFVLLSCLFTTHLTLLFFYLVHLANSLPRYQPQPWSPYCPEVPIGLYGRIRVNRTRFPTMDELERTHPEVAKGGEWRPKCLARYNVAILIPYRSQNSIFKN